MNTSELWTEVDADLYEVLHLDPRATDVDIQRAWHRRARSTHPDTGADVDGLREVHIAYLVLSDASARARYDRWRLAARLTTPASPSSLDVGPEPQDLGSPPSPVDSRLVLGLALVLLGCVVMSYAWPFFTLVVGCAVGAVVLTRYVRHWNARRTVP